MGFVFSCKKVIPLAGILLATTGCMDITGRGAAPLSRTVEPTVEVTHPRSGEVYCMRGWLGIFSTGMDDLAGEVDKEVVAVSVADEEWRRLKGFLVNEHKAGKLRTPLILVGHSWGADDSIRVAAALQKEGITVDLLVTIDPVTPDPIPPNVTRCYNIYKSHPASDAIPFWRGVPIDQSTTKVPVTNIDLRTAKVDFDTESIDHINIEKNEGVHRMVMQQIMKICMPRVAATVPAAAHVQANAAAAVEAPRTAATHTP